MMPGQMHTWMVPGMRAHMSRKDMLTNRGIVRMESRLRRSRFEYQLPSLLAEFPWLSVSSETGLIPAHHT